MRIMLKVITTLVCDPFLHPESPFLQTEAEELSVKPVWPDFSKSFCSVSVSFYILQLPFHNPGYFPYSLASGFAKNSLGRFELCTFRTKTSCKSGKEGPMCRVLLRFNKSEIPIWYDKHQPGKMLVPIPIFKPEIEVPVI